VRARELIGASLRRARELCMATLEQKACSMQAALH